MNISRRNILVAPLVITNCNLLNVNRAQATPVSGEEKTSNGWLIQHSLEPYMIEGSLAPVSLAEGMPVNVLSYVIRRWNYEIETLEKDSVRSFTKISDISAGDSDNFSSGTAIYINERKYPLGSYDVFFPTKLAVIRDILSELGGAVTWGGDYDIPAPGLFEVAYGPSSIVVEQASMKSSKTFMPTSAENIGNLFSLSY